MSCSCLADELRLLDMELSQIEDSGGRRRGADKIILGPLAGKVSSLHRWAWALIVTESPDVAFYLPLKHLPPDSRGIGNLVWVSKTASGELIISERGYDPKRIMRGPKDLL